MEFVRNVVPEGSASVEFRPRRKGAEEYVLVEKGRLMARLGGESYVLEEGDAVCFEADLVRRFENAGEGECSFYHVVGPG